VTKSWPSRLAGERGEEAAGPISRESNSTACDQRAGVAAHDTAVDRRRDLGQRQVIKWVPLRNGAPAPPRVPPGRRTGDHAGDLLTAFVALPRDGHDVAGFG
jgi:hypothetical protein